MTPLSGFTGQTGSYNGLKYQSSLLSSSYLNSSYNNGLQIGESLATAPAAIRASAQAGDSVEITQAYYYSERVSFTYRPEGSNVKISGEYSLEVLAYSSTRSVGQAVGETEMPPVTDLMEYFSPENTAQRIFEFATNFYDLYVQQNGGEYDQETLEDFVSLIRGAIDQGFDEAQQILGILPDSIQEGIDKTHSLVMQLLDSFLADKTAELNSKTQETEEDNAIAA